MKKISAFILTFFLTLSASSFSFAENVDVSGIWGLMNSDSFPPVTVHVVTESIINGQLTVSSYDISEEMVQLMGIFTNVTQTPDGIISGSIGNTTTINGKVTGDSITFTEAYRRTDLITNAQTISNATCSGTIVTNDPPMSKTINYTYSGTYNYKRVSASGLTTTTKTATFSNIPAYIDVVNTSLPLDTAILSGPLGQTTQKDVTFTWLGLGGSGGIAGYYYQLDAQAKVFTTATSMTFNNLSYGEHTFSVVAKDNAGNIDSTPATRTFTIGQTSPSPPSEHEFGTQAGKSTKDPINIVTGNMYILTTDLTLPGRGMNFEFTRSYNSQSSENNVLGYGWTHSLNLSLTQDTQNKLVKVKDEEGKGYLFADNQDGTFTSQRGEYSTLSKNSSNFIWRKKDGQQYLFDLSGKLTQIKDRFANSITLSYDPQNRLVRVADTQARIILFEYDSSNRLILIKDPLLRPYTYNYDSNNNLKSVSDPLGNTITYEYDSNHNLTRKTDPRGKLTLFTYDVIDRCTSSTLENDSGKVILSLDPANQRTFLTDSKGGQFTYYYNNDLLITKIVNPQSNQILSTWDVNYNLTSRTDELNRTTLMDYDVQGNLIKVTDPLGNVTSFTYEPVFNLLKTSTDPLGNITTFTYDAAGNLIQTTDPLNNSSTHTYNTSGQALTSINALSQTTTFTYDVQGNLSSTTDPLGNTTTFTYDTLGNLSQIKNAKNLVIEFTYDSLNRKIKTTYADGSLVSSTYDGMNNQTSLTDQEGHTTNYSFDQNNKIISLTNPLGYAVNYVYDTEGNLISVTDQNNNQTTYTYDSLNHLILETDALGYKKQYQYDAVDNLIKFTDPNNQIATFEYDSLNRLLKATYPDRTVSYTYDSLGRRTSLTEERGTTNYTYDKLGRLLQVDGPAANDTVSYTYDKLGNRLTMTDPAGKITSYSYDALNRLSSITDPQAKVTNYTYDALGNLTNLIYPNATKTTYSYDSLNRLLKLSEQLTSSPYTKLAEFSYSYDKLGRRTQVNLLDGSSINYTYDALGQLTGENKTSSTNPYQISYTYDPAGNRLEMINQGIQYDYSYNSLNQLTEESFNGGNPAKITVTGRASDPSGIKQIMVNGLTATLAGNTFTCADVTLTPGPNTLTVIATDQAGNSTTKILHVTYNPTTKIIYTYDQNGNLISKTGLGDTVNLSYDSTNRLTRFKNTALDETYQYDAEGRRIAKQSGSSTTTYLYDGLNVIQENSSAGSTNYTRNPNAPGGIGGIINQLSSTNIPTYYHYDGLGSVTNLTNSTAANTQSYSYDAFGNLQGLSPQGTVPAFLTKELDLTGLIYFGARYYDSKIGRFLTPDPMGFIDGPNVYIYSLNDPINNFDPYGLDTILVNYELIDAQHRPTKEVVSHTYVAITDQGSVTDTYSWGIGGIGTWRHNYPQDLRIAQEAVRAGTGFIWYGNESLDKYVLSEYNKINLDKGFYILIGNNCKDHAKMLLDRALRRLEEERKGKK